MIHKRTPIKLTPRGSEVFHMSLHGFTTARIAHHLKMTKSGVRRHKEKMLMVNGCDSMLELAAKYYGTYIEE